MAVIPLSNGFEGTNGANIAASLFGDSTVTFTGNGGCTYSNTYSHGGSTSARFRNEEKRARYLAPANKQESSGQGYFDFEKPSTSTRFLSYYLIDTGTVVFALSIAPTGKLTIKDGPDTVWSSAVDITAQGEVRVDWQLDLDTGDTLIVRLFYGADLEDPWASYTETSGTITLTTTTTGWDRIDLGWHENTNDKSFWVDDLQIVDTITTFDPASNPPVAAFSKSPASGDVPLTVAFTDLSSPAATSWSWDFGDAGTSTSQNPTHQYTSDGTFTVQLTATNADGSSSTTQTVTVNPVDLGVVPVEVRLAGSLVSVPALQQWIRIAGVLVNIPNWNGVTNVVDPGDDDPGPVDSRFPGDPGIGKCYVGSNRRITENGMTSEAIMDQWLTDNLSARTTAYSGPKTRKGQVVTSFNGSGAGDAKGSDPYDWDYPARQNNYYPSMRLVQYAHENGKIPWIEMQLGSQSVSWMTDVANATNAMETFYKNNVIAPIAARSDPVWICFDHEPENSSILAPSNKANCATQRAATRQIVQWWREEGATNIALGCTAYMMFTFKNGGRNQGRDWRLWYPDWKGTSQNGATDINADPMGDKRDFYTGTTKTGAAGESVVDVIGADVYYWHTSGGHSPSWGATTSIANTNNYEPMAWADELDRMLEFVGFLDKPIGIREAGFQACGYLDSNGNLVQRAEDTAKTVAVATNVIPHIQRGELVTIDIFNRGNHALDFVDPKRDKCKALATMLDGPTGTTVPIG